MLGTRSLTLTLVHDLFLQGGCKCNGWKLHAAPKQQMELMSNATEASVCIDCNHTASMHGHIPSLPLDEIERRVLHVVHMEKMWATCCAQKDNHPSKDVLYKQVAQMRADLKTQAIAYRQAQAHAQAAHAQAQVQAQAAHAARTQAAQAQHAQAVQAQHALAQARASSQAAGMSPAQAQAFSQIQAQVHARESAMAMQMRAAGSAASAFTVPPQERPTIEEVNIYPALHLSLSLSLRMGSCTYM